MEISLAASAATLPKGVYSVKIPLEMIHTLVQMRGTVSKEGIENLTAGIKAIGQMMAGIVVALTRADAVKYLSQINEMWGTAYAIGDFTPAYLQELNDHFYLFLVAGHRRRDAVEQAGITTFFCNLHVGCSFSEALTMQYQENQHEEVRQDEEAKFLTLLWRQEKSKHPKLTLGGFARQRGKTPEAMRRSVRFTSLPIRVQRLVLPSPEYKKGIAFGILCELARLQEARQLKHKPYAEQELLHLAYVLVVQQKTTKAAAAWVSEQIKQLQGQGDMFGLSIQDALDGARKSVGTGLERAVMTGDEHLRIVARMHESGDVPKVASGSAVSAIARTLHLANDLAPKIVENIKGARHASVAREAIKKAEE
ncbi:MAG: hypothetical protein NUV60_03320 [Patescibacteria group bacterium]|nr:hypothetical protein [Patescibacteria group bacterium]